MLSISGEVVENKDREKDFLGTGGCGKYTFHRVSTNGRDLRGQKKYRTEKNREYARKESGAPGLVLCQTKGGGKKTMENLGNPGSGKNFPRRGNSGSERGGDENCYLSIAGDSKTAERKWGVKREQEPPAEALRARDYRGCGCGVLPLCPSAPLPPAPLRGEPPGVRSKCFCSLLGLVLFGR